MPRPPKIALNNTVLFVTTSVEEGLMFPPNELINKVLLSCMIKAQLHHPVQICHFLVEATHIHFIMRVENPDDVRGFMERFKTESAHAVNRLLGRPKRTLWCKGYDSPVLLTEEDVIDKIVYLYENPSKDDLEDSIEKYPGLSTWRAFRAGEKLLPGYLIARTDIQPLPQGIRTSPSLYPAIARKLCEKKKRAELSLSLDAWMRCFGITEQSEKDAINKRIRLTLSDREKTYTARRAQEKRSVIGAAALLRTPIGRDYVPKREGRRMYCICYDRGLRKEFIGWIKSLITRAKEVLERWRGGDRSEPYPLGLYPPSLPRVAELIGV